VRLPLLGRARDLHPLDYAHVGRTTKGDRRPNRTSASFFCVIDSQLKLLVALANLVGSNGTCEIQEHGPSEVSEAHAENHQSECK